MCVALMMATLNDLEIMAAGIINVYIQLAATKTAWTTLGPEFDSNNARTTVTDKAFCGGGTFRNYLKSSMRY